jgi:hypothetical protein
MNWDKTMVERAAAEGWRLITIVDSGTTHPYLMIGRTEQSALPDDQRAGEHVVRMARANMPLHRHALQTVMQSRVRPPKKGSKK